MLQTILNHPKLPKEKFLRLNLNRRFRMNSHDHMLLESSYNLTKSQVELYNEKGFVFIPELASEQEISFYRKEIREVVQKLNNENRPLDQRDTYGKAFLQIKNLWRHSDLAKKFVLSQRFGKVAAQLMGVEKVRLYHDQALFKEPGGGHTPWHQDQFYWPLKTEKTITLWMPLIDLTEDMGLMKFIAGSHKKGYMIAKEISDESDEYFESFIKENKLEIDGPRTLKAGDATFHSGWTLHNATANNSNQMREVMTIIYYPDGTEVLEPDHDWRQKDLEVWLGGKLPGEVADSYLNPLVF